MSADEQALRDIVAQLETAWNNGDSVAWTKPFAEDADFIHVLGGHFTGAPAIEHGHRVIFDTIYKGSALKLEVEKIRFVGETVAIVFLFTTLKVVQPGLPPQMNARPTLIAERRDGTWKIVTFQNTLVTPEGASPTQALADKHPIKGQAKATGS
jgi:uncharacterized protein (TIGR02246 family)